MTPVLGWSGKDLFENLSCDSSEFGIGTQLGGTHLPSFLGVIFTKGERNLKSAHMRLKKSAAPLPPSARSKIQSQRVSRHNGHNCRNSGIVRSKPRWVKRVGVSRIHKGSQIKSPIEQSSEPFLLLLLFYQSSHLAWLEWHTCLRRYGEFLQTNLVEKLIGDLFAP